MACLHILQATAKVEITVQDDNDNTPQFTQHRYITHTTEGKILATECKDFLSRKGIKLIFVFCI